MPYGTEGFGEGVTRRTLKVFWLVDASTSMRGVKMATLNQAIRDCIPEMIEITEENPEVEMRVNVIEFRNEAKYLHRDVKIQDFKWTDITAKGKTSTGAALDLLRQELTVEKMGKRGLPPLMILMSDGGAGDHYDKALKLLIDDKWGERAIRIPIAIGEKCHEDKLLKFQNPKEGALLKANNARDLTKLIKWASVTVSNTLSQSQGGGQLPPPPVMNQVTLGGTSLDDNATF